jgi:hypothetical protein
MNTSATLMASAAQADRRGNVDEPSGSVSGELRGMAMHVAKSGYRSNPGLCRRPAWRRSIIALSVRILIKACLRKTACVGNYNHVSTLIDICSAGLCFLPLLRASDEPLPFENRQPDTHPCEQNSIAKKEGFS